MITELPQGLLLWNKHLVMSFLQLFLVLIIFLICLLFLLFPSPLAKLVFGCLARPTSSLIDIQELDVTDTIKVKSVHESKRHVTVENVLQIGGNFTQWKIGYGDSCNTVGKFGMSWSLALGENESNLELWAKMSKSAAVPPVKAPSLYNKNRTCLLLNKGRNNIHIFPRKSAVVCLDSGRVVSAP